jgi:hypothetical protein
MSNIAHDQPNSHEPFGNRRTILISHDVPRVFEVPDRMDIQLLGRRVAVVTPMTQTMSTAAGITTGALPGIKTAPADHAGSATYLRHRLELSAMS